MKSEKKEASLCNEKRDTLLIKKIEQEPERLLPKKLRKKLKHRVAFRRAFMEGYIRVEDGVVVSYFQTTELLSYFCGRCFSNDRSKKFQQKRVWVKESASGYTTPFPGRALEAFFDERHIKQSRNNYINFKIPKGWEIVDNLFDN